MTEAFARVIDAKSPWTARHSDGVSEAAVGIGAVLGFSRETLRDLRRAALLHAIGKLGISNLILDKPGPLSAAERAEMRRHPLYTQQILSCVACFRDFAGWASAHHERMDGQGYHRGLPAGDLPTGARILMVADIYDALSAERPYRARLPQEQALAIMRREVGAGLCPLCFEALLAHLKTDDGPPVEFRCDEDLPCWSRGPEQPAAGRAALSDPRVGRGAAAGGVSGRPVCPAVAD